MEKLKTQLIFVTCCDVKCVQNFSDVEIDKVRKRWLQDCFVLHYELSIHKGTVSL